ncbi:MAG: glycosyltransferase family 9 protein [Vicinamibacteria bacterium]|nr:glycosyltransferase family 9 protein [Vicinamibacteria bacterium]
MKILVVRLSSIGDVVHTTPMVAALLEAGHEVAWAVEPPGAPLVASIKGLNQVFILPKASTYDWNDRFRLARTLRDFNPDVAIDAQGLWKSAFWTWLSGAPRRIGWMADQRREASSSVMLTETVACTAEDVHVIDQHQALLRGLGVDDRGSREFPYVLPEEAWATAVAYRATLENPLALISPGGGWENKLYPPKLWGQVAVGLAEMRLAPVVLWGPGEEELAGAVIEASGGKAKRAPATSVLELAALAKSCRIFLAADTGPLHVAGAMGAPLVGVFGPTDPARNGPWAEGDEVVRKTPACAPCHKRNCDTHQDIMKKIQVSEVLEAATRRMSTSTDRVPA